ncbi:MAG: amylo-alpha-1,6-glucosidase [Cyanobacteriota bacterium]|nr:amylo-alpha-1,6-glucosidase [Cyanobacteriota bacterium]
MTIQFGREICGNLAIARSREWLVTNGIGGYGSGTIAGVQTRCYHGLLFAALKPPLGRTLLLASLDEMVRYEQKDYPLYSHARTDGTIAPHGYQEIESFRLEGTTPVWRFACGDAAVEKCVWMQQGENTTYVRYTVCRASNPLLLTLKTFVNYRDYHSQTHSGDWEMQIDPIPQGLKVTAFEEATPFYLFADVERVHPTVPQPKLGLHVPQWIITNKWSVGFDLAKERDRGLGDGDDRLYAADLEVMLEVGDSLTVIATTEANPLLNGETALQQRQAYEFDLVQRWRATGGLPQSHTPDWVQQLVLAADQFIVNRPLPEIPSGKTIIAGYHWFGDWGRDTAISLPGLTLATGRADIARTILLTFARYLDGGMLPNLFPEAGETPAYNTVDAALWYVEAVGAYWAATGDEEAIAQLFPALVEIIHYYRTGTRYQIHLDPDDGLIYAGEAGMQLTWMDVKIDDWVVTPRIGKPVEVNALWYNALRIVGQLARQLNRSDREYEELAQRARQGFHRFWNASKGYCYDVLDRPEGSNDASLRPNQIFAVSLPAKGTQLLSLERQQSVVQAVARSLLTSHGLRSLSMDDPDYQGVYGGDRVQRDRAYHQGTVWGWLLGPFVQAHLNVYGDPCRARQFLEPIVHHLQDACVGSLSEIFDGNAPMMPRGAIAQAWTVAEILRIWHLMNNE